MPGPEMGDGEHESIESNESLPTCFFVAQNIFVCISVIRVRYYKKLRVPNPFSGQYYLYCTFIES